MRIHFALDDRPDLASWRYRCAIPARELAARGHEISRGLEEKAPSPATIVFEKHYDRHIRPDVLAFVRERDKGIRIVFDICDNYFADAERGDYYREMCQLADIITVSSHNLREAVHQETGHEAFFIPDAYAFDEKPPAFWPVGGEPRLLWYGNPKNLRALGAVMPQIRGFRLVALTLPHPKYFPMIRPWWRDALRVIRPWSERAMLRQFALCDIVIIPSLKDEFSQAKSANRMVEAIRQGKFVVAEPMEAYAPFSPWMYIGNIREGIEWALANHSEIEGRIAAAQAYVREEFAPARIGALWEAALS